MEHFKWVILKRAIQLRGVTKHPGTRHRFSRHAADALVAQGKARYEKPTAPSTVAKVVTTVPRSQSKSDDFMARLKELQGTKGGFKKAKSLVEELGVKANSWDELLSETEAALKG